ncbi:PREDICTED: RNA-directed DNA polymerase from mobile element jockey-like, partial [Trachymyrmex cornetzi]|uniref:RNA-directed DNA polymerase from mobile element jockey-like n=1 Tax=Trachymyrmex cornetzi TaxID=471704 RepID=UPI00084F01BA
MNSTRNSQRNNTNSAITSWNCRGIKNKLPEFHSPDNNYEIWCLQETKLAKDAYLFSNTHNFIRKDIDTPGQSGIAIAIKKSIFYETLDFSLLHLSVELMGINIQILDSTLTIINIYRHPGTNTPLSFFQQLFNYATICNNTIIMGDFNAHNIDWGCSSTDRSGRLLSQALDQYNLIICNDYKPTLQMSNSEHISIIDLVIATPSASTLFDCSTGKDTHSSDHFPILIRFMSKINPKKIFKYKIKLDTQQVKDFYHSLYTNPPSINSQTFPDILDRYKNLVTIITETLYSLFSPGSRTPASKSAKERNLVAPPWWTQECQDAVEKRRAANIKYFKTSSSENWTAYKKEVTECRRILRKTKKHKWRDFCKSFTGNTPSAHLWKLVKVFKNRRLAPPIQPTEELRKAQSLAINKLCPPTCSTLSTPSINEMLAEDSRHHQGVASDLDRPITMKELQHAIQSTKRTSAPGLDQIDYVVIQNLPQAYLKELLAIYNGLFESGIFPEDWTRALIVLIPKSG